MLLKLVSEKPLPNSIVSLSERYFYQVFAVLAPVVFTARFINLLTDFPIGKYHSGIDRSIDFLLSGNNAVPYRVICVLLMIVVYDNLTCHYLSPYQLVCFIVIICFVFRSVLYIR